MGNQNLAGVFQGRVIYPRANRREPSLLFAFTNTISNFDLALSIGSTWFPPAPLQPPRLRRRSGDGVPGRAKAAGAMEFSFLTWPRIPGFARRYYVSIMYRRRPMVRSFRPEITAEGRARGTEETWRRTPRPPENVTNVRSVASSLRQF